MMLMWLKEDLVTLCSFW